MDMLDPYKRTDIKPDTGKLLIAEPFLTDPEFARSVVLLCSHGEEGTIGFVLNRISMNNIGDLLPDMLGIEIPIYDGGPVQPDTLHIIHKIPEEMGGVEIFPGVYWGSSYENLSRMIEDGRVDQQNVRLFAGYAGWETGQLESEMKEKSWIVAGATEKIIFEQDSTQIWRMALKSLGDDFAYMANLPLHPQLN